MLKQQAKFLNRIVISIDMIVIMVSFCLAYFIGDRWGNLSQLSEYIWLLLVVVPLWYFLLDHFGLYESLWYQSIGQIMVCILKAQFIGSIILAAAIYVMEPVDFSRALFVYLLIISFLFISFEKIIIKLVLSHFRRRGYNYRNILIVGTDKKAIEFLKIVENHVNWGMRIVGFLKLADDEHPQVPENYKIHGCLKDLVVVCNRMPVDEVVFCVPSEALPDLEDYVRDMEEMGVNVRLVLDFYDLKRSKRDLSLFHGELPILTFYSRSFDTGHLFLKRCLDLVGATTGLIITLLLFPFIALAIKLDSPGPLFFGQKRIGKRGRVFTCWKFRSMYTDAEERKKELMHLNEMNGAIFKIKDDPRITKVGKILRKTSLDELPQFWNVLRNEMSLVGTRPPTPDEVAKYENWHRKRICIKPGITGMWQVSGRNAIEDFDEVAALDIEYIEKWSLWLDVKILFKTLWVVFARSGSY